MSEIKKYTIKTTYRNDKDKNGNALVSKAGKPYTKLALKVQEIANGESWVSGFGNKINESWKEGDVVELIVTKNGDYYNFETPTKESRLEARVAALEVQMMNVVNMLSKTPSAKSAPTASSPSVDDIAAEFNNLPPESDPPY